VLSSHDFIYLKLNRAKIERFIHNDIVDSLHNLPISGNKKKNTSFWEFQKKITLVWEICLSYITHHHQFNTKYYINPILEEVKSNLKYLK